MTARIRRHPRLDDWYAENGESVALVGDQVFVLNPVATALVGLVGDEWTSVVDVLPELVERFGRPPTGAEETTLDIAAELAASGVLDLEVDSQGKG